MCDCCEKYYYQKEDLPSEICEHIKSYIKYSSEKAVSAAMLAHRHITCAIEIQQSNFGARSPT